MKTFKMIAAVFALAMPAFVASGPAQASTSHQYMAQGRGNYVSSNSRVRGLHFHRHHRRHRSQR